MFSARIRAFWVLRSARANSMNARRLAGSIVDDFALESEVCALRAVTGNRGKPSAKVRRKVLRERELVFSKVFIGSGRLCLVLRRNKFRFLILLFLFILIHLTSSKPNPDQDEEKD